MQYFQGSLLFKVSNTLLGFIEPIKKNSYWAVTFWCPHLGHFGAHTWGLKVSRALSKSSGPGLWGLGWGLGLAGEKLPHFVPGWQVSEKSHKSETDHSFNPESNTEYSLPPQETILFTSLWCYLVSNLFPAQKKNLVESPEMLTPTTKSWKMLSKEPQIHQAKAGCLRSGRWGWRNRFSRKHSALPFLPMSLLWKPGMSWFTYPNLRHCYKVPLQHTYARACMHPPYLI